MGRQTVANETIDRIANRLLAPKNAEDMPVILARRYTPHPRTYLLWDAGWEGLKKTVRAGKPYWEIDRNFNLRIELDGLCQIPNTPNNKLRLEKCSKPYVVELRQDPVTGLPYDPPRKVKYPPEYRPVEETILEQTIVEQIAEKVFAKMRETQGETPDLRDAPGPDHRLMSQRNIEAPELLDDEDLDDSEGPTTPVDVPARRRAPAAKKPGKKKPAKRGRPRSPDPLLDPVRP